MKAIASLVLLAALALLAFAHFDVLSAQADTFGSGANTFDIEFVRIGNPGNAADTTGNPSPPYPTGSVGYIYNIGKYEVSRDMVTKANSAGGLGITLWDMTPYGGNGANRPATGVSWNEAARFVNWLNTSQGFTPAYKFTTQPGDGGYVANQNISLWVSGESGFNAANPFRNSQAHYFLPSVDEWYKAAYYDPSANGGAGGYWDYPTGSDSAPTAVASGTAAGTAVYLQAVATGPADITMAGGLSPYGTMAQGGNVIELEETEFDLVNNVSSSARGIRGGSWISNSSNLSSPSRVNDNPTDDESRSVGFRVASIPEPSTLLLAALAAAGLLWRRPVREGLGGRGTLIFANRHSFALAEISAN